MNNTNACKALVSILLSESHTKHVIH